MSWLKEVRQKRNLTQSQLGTILGLSASAVGMYEQGRRTPAPGTILKIADYFGVTMDYLYRKMAHPDTPQHDLQPQVSKSLIPILRHIPAASPVFQENNIEGYETVEPELVETGEYFYFRVSDNNMANTRLLEGDIVLVKMQNDVEDGDVAVINIGNERATIRRLFKIDKFYLLYPDSLTCKPSLINKEKVRILGKVIAIKIKL